MIRLLVLGLTICAAGCSDDTSKNAPDAPVTIDAMPDAFSCPAIAPTQCGEVCIDTTSNPMHCGDCDQACGGGQVCSNSMCDCVPASIPTPLPQLLQEQIISMQGFHGAAAGFINSGRTDGIALLYDPVNSPIGMDVPLQNIPASPSLVYAYNGDVGSLNAEAFYVATAGTVNFTSACDVGVEASFSGLTFTAMNDNFQPVPGGCSFTVSDFTFAVPSTGPNQCP